MWPKTLLAPSLRTRPGARCTALTLGQRPVTSLSRVPACVPFLPPMSEGPLSLLELLPHCQRHLQSRQRHTLCLHGSLPASSCCCLRWCLRASQTCHLPAPEAGGPRGFLGAEIGASPGQHPRPCPLASRRHPSFRSGTVLHPQSQHVPPRGPRPLPPAAPQGPCAPGHPVPRRRPVSRPCLHHTCRVAFAMRWAGHRLRGGCGPGLTSAPTRTDAPASPLSGARPRRGPGRPRAHWVPHKLEMSLQQDLSPTLRAAEPQVLGRPQCHTVTGTRPQARPVGSALPFVPPTPAGGTAAGTAPNRLRTSSEGLGVQVAVPVGVGNLLRQELPGRPRKPTTATGCSRQSHHVRLPGLSLVSLTVTRVRHV